MFLDLKNMLTKSVILTSQFEVVDTVFASGDAAPPSQGHQCLPWGSFCDRSAPPCLLYKEIVRTLGCRNILIDIVFIANPVPTHTLQHL